MPLPTPHEQGLDFADLMRDAFLQQEGRVFALTEVCVFALQELSAMQPAGSLSRLVGKLSHTLDLMKEANGEGTPFAEGHAQVINSLIEEIPKGLSGGGASIH